MLNVVKNSIIQNISTNQLILNDIKFLETITGIADLCIEAYRNGNKILICGNGGSASDAQHMTGELVGRFKMDRVGLPAIALDSNTVIITALANDYSYEEVFSKQVCAFGQKGDILIGITTSGNSQNIVNAFKIAKRIGIKTIGLTGKNIGKIQDLCDFVLNVPTDNTPHIQEAHIMIIHILCDIIEKQLFSVLGDEKNK